MRVGRGLALVLALAFSLALTSQAFAAQEVPLSKDVIKKIAGGSLSMDLDKTISIAGQLCDGYIHISYGYWITLDIRGWDRWRAKLGVPDSLRGKSVTVTTEVDGETVWTKQIRSGEKAIPVEVPLTSGKALTIRVSDRSVVFAEPRLIKGAAAGSASSASGTSATPAQASGASFAVEAKDLDALASGLRRQVDADPDLKRKVDDGIVALMDFILVDIVSKSVATNVAEDLSTSMIKNHFSLVERRQLDKALKDLAFRDTAFVNPTTAKKIGQFLGCDVILVGSISDRGDRVVVNCRLLETATGKALAAERVEMRKVPINR